jgi:hypothetical protein
VVEYSCSQAQQLDNTKEMALQALQRESQLKWQVVTKYIQKPPLADDTPQEEMADEQVESAPKRLTQAEFETEFRDALAKEKTVFTQSV